MSPFRPDLFAGRVALLTGGGTGITRGIAEAARRATGPTPSLLSRKAEHLHPTAKEITHHHKTRCLAIEADVRHPEAMEAAACMP